MGAELIFNIRVLKCLGISTNYTNYREALEYWSTGGLGKRLIHYSLRAQPSLQHSICLKD